MALLMFDFFSFILGTVGLPSCLWAVETSAANVWTSAPNIMSEEHSASVISLFTGIRSGPRKELFSDGDWNSNKERDGQIM